MFHLLLTLALWCLPLAAQPHPDQPAVPLPNAFDCPQVEPGGRNLAPLPRLDERGFLEGPYLA
jgi:hypothetical protein